MSDGAKHMVVGIDGSPGSAHAIEWAVAHAPQLGVIRPVTAWHEPWWSSRPPAPGMPRLPEELRHEKQVREHVGEQLAGIEPAMLDEPVVARGRAGPMLVSAARGASLLVVGTRGRGPLADTVLGSVSHHCVSHATSPVVVVPAVAPNNDRVVVGVDGSEAAGAALEWAVANTPSSTIIEAVHVWQLEPGGETEARQLLSMAVDAIRASHPADADRIEPLVEWGDPRHVLYKRGEEADLVVLGPFGHRGIPRLLVGSVAAALTHRPTTPTVIVR